MEAVAQTQSKPFQLSFNGRLEVKSQGSSVAWDAGLLVVRNLPERMGSARSSSETLPVREVWQNGLLRSRN